MIPILVQPPPPISRAFVPLAAAQAGDEALFEDELADAGPADALCDMAQPMAECARLPVLALPPPAAPEEGAPAEPAPAARVILQPPPAPDQAADGAEPAPPPQPKDPEHPSPPAIEGTEGMVGKVTLRPARLAAPIISPPAIMPVDVLVAPSAPISAPAEATPTAPVRAFQALLGDLARTRHDGVDISLSDQTLGPVQFAIVTEGNSVVITVTAELAATRTLMQAHAQDLLTALRQAGFQTAILNWGRPPARPAVAEREEDGPVQADDGPLDLRI